MAGCTSFVNMKIPFASYVLLVLCVQAAVAQFIGSQTQSFEAARHGLSPQQQGHILSDIQQHQHRFNILPQQQQQQQQQPFPTPQFSQPSALNSANLFNNAQTQSFPTNFQQQTVIQNQFTPQLVQNHFLQNQPIPPTNAALLGPSPISPTNQPGNFQNNRLVQHHTQTSFTPAFNPQAVQSFNQKPQTLTDSILSAGQQKQVGQLDPEQQKQRLKELKDKQAIIDKHNQFVEKQYEKALKKAQSDHTEFLDTQREEKKKLYQSLYKTSGYDNIRYTQTNPRYIYPEEAGLFKLAVKKYYDEHPTTTTTTTTTTTPKPTTTKTIKPESPRSIKSSFDPESFLSTSHSKLYSQIKSATEVREATASSDQSKQISFLPTVLPNRKTIQSLDDLNVLQKQYKNQQIKKDDLLAQLKLAIGDNAEEELSKNITSREISLPNGQTVQIIRTTDPKLIPGAKPLDLSLPEFQNLVPSTTAKPPKAVLEELTKGLLPPGANFELLKQGSGGLEQVGGLPQNLPNQKKVTFVLLEEQNDGSFKVQGVKGNGNAKEKSEVDVDSILKKIKDGEIKLPPSTKIQSTTAAPTSSSTTKAPIISSTVSDRKTTMEIIKSISISPNSFTPSDDDDEIADIPILKTNIGTHFVASSTASPSPSTHFSSTNSVHSTTARSIDNHSPKMISDFSLRFSPSSDLVRQASTASTSSKNSLFTSSFPAISTIQSPKPTIPTYSTAHQNAAVTAFSSHSTALPTASTNLEDNDDVEDELPEVLKHNGLYAMARFLRQSGLDTILNETGPYTVFAPSDKAFRTLMVQLGGPEKAEEKFKENPRLLSGLLLHHVIPGAFKIETLQDEMTGVSLAGTQLRVNQYNMHDLEWNDIKITTINGAKVLDEKKNIEIPQGIAHAIDRVMFPLPVGDIVQTLQSDRERRFTSFLRALFASGLAETLQGTKTFTLFAPTDKAFSVLTSDELTRTVSDRVLARELVMRHLTPGTLYTNGMRYYQIRDSLEPNRQITLSKSSGRIRVNNNLIITPNIPSTNGVIHALDTLL